MKVLEYSIMTKLIIKNHKRNVEMIFSVKDIKKYKKAIFFKGTFPLIKASQEVSKEDCKILTFKYLIMSQYNYPKINQIKLPENYVFFHNVKYNTIIDSRVSHILL